MIFLKIITVIISPFLLFGACWLGGKLGMEAARRDKKKRGETIADKIAETERISREARPATVLQIYNGQGGEIKTPYGAVMAEAARRSIAEEKPAYSPQLYIGAANLAAALVKAGKAAAGATVGFKRFSEELREYAKRAEEIAAKEGRPKRNDAVDALQYSLPWSYYVARMLYPNKRVVHLAAHAKKKRVRKKNINRINEWYARGRH